MGDPAPWFRREIATGLQRLIALALPGQPPAETIKLTAAAWCEFLWSCGIGWEEKLDAPRIVAAFASLGRRIERWPAPTHLRQNLPLRPDPRALAEPDSTPAQVERINFHIGLTRQLLAMPKKPK